MATLEMVLAGQSSGKGLFAAVKTTAATGTMTGKAAMVTKGAGAASGATKMTLSKVLFSSKGLGIGLGFGSLAPFVVSAFGAMAIYVYWKECRHSYD